MRFSIFILFLWSSLLWSCSDKSVPNTILSRDSLTLQSFEISLDNDTTLKTTGGAVLTIPKGTFISESRRTIVLEIKEAYDPESMLRAGLTTKSGEGPLSSGGMIYVGSKDSSEFQFAGKIKIALPTPSVNPSMSVFKGEFKVDGGMHWTNDTTLQNPEDVLYAKGQELFNGNCTSCHEIGKIKVGPDLAYIGERRKKEWLYSYTRNSIKLIKGYGDEMHDSYAACLYKYYNKTEMTAFQNLKDEELDAMYGFIDKYSFWNKLSYPKDELFHCTDSCSIYLNKIEELTRKKKNIKRKGKNSWKNMDRTSTLPSANDTASVSPIEISSTQQTSTVQPFVYQPDYYQIEINTFGWYNIDILIKKLAGIVDCNLQVNIEGDRKGFIAYMVVPDYNVLLSGGLMSDNITYVFDKTDGSAPLPLGGKAHIIMMKEDKEGVWFKIHSFIIKKEEKIRLNVAFVKPEMVTQEIKKLKLKDFNLEVKQTAHYNEVRKIEMQLQAAELLKPKKCDCDCSSDAAEVFMDSLSADDIWY